MVWHSVFGTDSETFHSSNIQTPLGPTQPPIHCVLQVLFLEYSSQGMKMTTHLHPAPMLKMNADIYLYSPYIYALTECLHTSTTLLHKYIHTQS